MLNEDLKVYQRNIYISLYMTIEIDTLAPQQVVICKCNMQKHKAFVHCKTYKPVHFL